jgi:hypothetical protein
MTKKRYPWEDQPYVDSKAAHERAIKAAQRPYTDTKSPAVTAYAQRALEHETETLRGTPKGGGPQGGRNGQLFLSAANLFEFVAAGVLTEDEVTRELENACRSNGSIQDDGMGQFEKTMQSGRRKGLDSPRDLSKVGQNGYAFHDTDPIVESVKLSTVFDLEQGFWESRTSLTNIYVGALARMCPPWAVLGYCAARALALVRPRVMLPPLVGGPGSLNWFCAITARSGGGKSSAHSVARELVQDYVLQRNLGSGEGLVDAFVKPANKETGEPRGLHESIMFVADEIDNMAALGNRSGSTLNGNLRIGFTADKLGFSYRQASDQHLEAHSYRMTLVVNVQPARAGALLDDVHGGMLQRFMWLPGTDPRIDSQTPDMPEALDLPSHNEWAYPRRVVIPYEATELIRDERMRNARGEMDSLDGHSLFIREKFAFALAVLDGRHEMTYDDWRLAGIASRVSDRTREWVVAELENAARDDAAKKGELLGVSQHAAEDSKANAHRERMNRISRTLMKAFEKSGDNSLTKTQLNRAVAGRDKAFIPTILERLAEQGRITRSDKGNAERWVKVVG